MPFQIAIYHPVVSNNCNIISSSVKPQYKNTAEVILTEEQPYIRESTSGIINEKQINIRKIELRCISAQRSWSLNTVVLTILTFQHIRCLHFMYDEVALVLVSLATQVQLLKDQPGK